MSITTFYLSFLLLGAAGNHLPGHTGNDFPAQQVFCSGHTATIEDFTTSFNNNKTLLSWSVSLNEKADHIEVERSVDGKSFSLAGLVLCSEKSATDHYRFYEPATKKKVYYRLRLVCNDHSVSYSDII